MKEELKAARFDGGNHSRGCDRAEELVAHLYGESGPTQAQTFRRHLDGCAVCRDELSAFGDVREAVGEWRADALAFPPALDFKEAFADPTPLAPRPAARKRSASAALREFFNLSPLWLRAGACAAALAVCALSALTLARAEVRWDANGLAFRTNEAVESVAEKQVSAPAANAFTPEQVEEIVKRRLEIARGEWESKQSQPRVVEVNENERRPAPQTQAATSTAPSKRKRVTPRAARRGVRNFEDEDSLPRLSDLLSGVH